MWVRSDSFGHGERLDVGRLREEIEARDPDQAEAALLEGRQIPGQGRRVAGEVDHPGRGRGSKPPPGASRFEADRARPRRVGAAAARASPRASSTGAPRTSTESIRAALRLSRRSRTARGLDSMATTRRKRRARPRVRKPAPAKSSRASSPSPAASCTASARSARRATLAWENTPAEIASRSPASRMRVLFSPSVPPSGASRETSPESPAASSHSPRGQLRIPVELRQGRRRGRAPGSDSAPWHRGRGSAGAGTRPRLPPPPPGRGSGIRTPPATRASRSAPEPRRASRFASTHPSGSPPSPPAERRSEGAARSSRRSIRRPGRPAPHAQVRERSSRSPRRGDSGGAPRWYAPEADPPAP